MLTAKERDKFWQPCRYGEDLRTCGSGYRKSVQDDEYPTCQRDGKPCDAKWNGERGPE